MRDQKGITLVALVVTIVVLLILAGTSIAMLSGDNGIITQAQKSNYANTEGEVFDKIKLAYNTVSSEVRIKAATETGFDATAEGTFTKLVNLVKADLGMAETESTKDGYTIDSSTNGTIVVTYSDSIFKSKADGTKDDKAKYPAIKFTMTVTADKVTLDSPSRVAQ